MPPKNTYRDKIQFMKRPKILEDAGFDLYVDTSKLRDLPLPVEQKKLEELTWCFDFPVWEKDGTDDWNLTPRQVIDKEPGTSEHMKKVEGSNLEYPIVIIFNKDRWVILDGIHRLVKSYLLKKPTIDVKILSKDSPYLISK